MHAEGWKPPLGRARAPDSGDSPAACAALAQPRLPITDAQVYAGMGEGLADLAILRVFGPLTVIVPHPGVLLRGERRTLALSWSASVPVGPVSACRRTMGGASFFYAHRLVLETTFVPVSPPGLTARAGYRYIHHGSGSRVGVGAGLAAALELTGAEAVRPGVSPELLLHLGRCCHTLYWLASLRWDHLFAWDEGDQWIASLGFVFW